MDLIWFLNFDESQKKICVSPKRSKAASFGVFFFLFASGRLIYI
jgi:hypothetical protein